MIHGVSTKRFFIELKNEISEDNISNGAAALAYYLTLAIFPGIILMMSIIPFLPIANVDKAIMDTLAQILPHEAYDMVAKVVDQVTHNRNGGLLSFGALGTLWAASAGMYAIMQQLNMTYDVKEGRSFIRARAIAVLLSLVFALLVIGAFSLVVFGGMIQDWIGERFGFTAGLLDFFAAFRWVIIVLALLLAFAMIYKFAPDVQQKFAFITPGSIMGVLLLILASLGFTYYADHFGNYDATYGSLGAVIILMLWLYIAGLVILLGSEINALIEHYSDTGKRKGEKVEGVPG
jgi:membrane protein